jgi:CheY-like chemotaxis protein
MDRVLVVDEHPESSHQMSMLLEDFGYQVEVATNSMEAASFLRRARPALLVVDLEMTMLDSWTVLEQVQRDPTLADLPTLVLTTGADTVSAVSRKFRPSACLLKPVLPMQLRDVVDRTLRMQRAGATSRRSGRFSGRFSRSGRFARG